MLTQEWWLAIVGSYCCQSCWKPRHFGRWAIADYWLVWMMPTSDMTLTSCRRAAAAPAPADIPRSAPDFREAVSDESSARSAGFPGCGAFRKYESCCRNLLWLEDYLMLVFSTASAWFRNRRVPAVPPVSYGLRLKGSWVKRASFWIIIWNGVFQQKFGP